MSGSVLLIGQLPPPYGGISIHVEALHAELKNHGVRSEVVRFRSVQFVRRWWQFDILHLHEISAISKIFLPLFKLAGKKVVLSVHGDGLQDQLTRNEMLPLSGVGKVLLKLSLKSYDAVVAGNDGIKTFLLNLNLEAGRLHVVPEFIPFIKDWDYRQHRADIVSAVKGRKVLYTSGDLREYKGAPLYGFDILLEFASRHRELASQFCFLINLINEPGADKVVAFRRKVDEEDLNDYVIVNDSPFVSSHSLIRDAFAVLRLTNTDGNSVSVLESLYFGVPVIASDCVPRPASCILFKSRDKLDFAEKMNVMMHEHDLVKMNIHESFDSYERIVDIYESIR